MLNRLTPYVIMAHGRSGSHYLQNLLLARLGIFAMRCHKAFQITNNDSFVISVVRHPHDAMASDLAKEIHFLNNHEDSQEFLDFVNRSNYGFVNSMNEILEYADIIVDFNELVNSPDTVIDKIVNILNIRVFHNDVDISVEDRPEGHPTNPFVPSSKGFSTYGWVYDTVAKADISESIEAYHRVVAKAI